MLLARDELSWFEVMENKLLTSAAIDVTNGLFPL